MAEKDVQNADLTMMEGLKAGQEQAWFAFFPKTFGELRRRVALRFGSLSPAHSPTDAAQHALMVGARNLRAGTIRGMETLTPDTFLAYLTRVAYLSSLYQQRKRLHEVARDQRAARPEKVQDDPLANVAVDEMLDRLLTAPELDPETAYERSAILQRWMDGYTAGQIVQALAEDPKHRGLTTRDVDGVVADLARQLVAILRETPDDHPCEES
jgi:DNA-directed RNA polymerase specialized sigma24 family protein